MADQDSGAKAAVITIRKYANRRLYNTHTSSYVTLDHLAEMVKEGAVVIDVGISRTAEGLDGDV